jgi:hypothetical protein
MTALGKQEPEHWYIYATNSALLYILVAPTRNSQPLTQDSQSSSEVQPSRILPCLVFC